MIITCACICRSTKKGEFFIRYGLECMECLEHCFKELEAKEAEFKCIRIEEVLEVEEP